MSSSQPTTRSRSLLFFSYRDSQSRSTRFSRTRINSYDDNYPQTDEHDRLITIDVDLPPKWFVSFYNPVGSYAHPSYSQGLIYQNKYKISSPELKLKVFRFLFLFQFTFTYLFQSHRTRTVTRETRSSGFHRPFRRGERDRIGYNRYHKSISSLISILYTNYLYRTLDNARHSSQE
jgi:hypothetical protein